MMRCARRPATIGRRGTPTRTIRVVYAAKVWKLFALNTSRALLEFIHN
jgi:hypothetical protein